MTKNSLDEDDITFTEADSFLESSNQDSLRNRKQASGKSETSTTTKTTVVMPEEKVRLSGYKFHKYLIENFEEDNLHCW